MPLFTLALVTSLLLIGLSLSSRGHETVRADEGVLMAIDADPVTSGIQNCVSVDTDDDVDVDFVIQNVPDIEGFGLRLLYDNNIVSMQSKDRTDSILGTSGLDAGDPLPESSNSYLDAYAVAIEPAPSGNGILTRYTIHAEAAGLTRLHLVVGNIDTNYVDSSLVTHLPDQTQDAFISVGAPCPDDTTDRDSDGVKDLGADGIAFTADDDSCPSASNAGQEDRDSDTLGDACDPVVMTIDADPASPKTQSCRGNVTTGSAVDLLIRSANPEAFQLRLTYDNGVVSFADRSATWSVLGTSGLEDGGPPDDTSRMFHAYAGNAAVVPNDGILMRYTVNALGNGLTRLHLINGPQDSAWVAAGIYFYVADQTPDAFLEVGGPCPSPENDRDSDGFTDYVDTCPNISDPGQEDIDGDGIGDACDADDDNDAVLDANDNCPKTVNTNQADNDSDGVPGTQPPPGGTFGGDACDADDDNDTVPDTSDTAPLNPYVCQDLDTDTCDDCAVLGVANPAQDGTDTDSDGACNAGDLDDDNDTVIDVEDTDPLNAYVCRDLDIDTCDDCSVLGQPDVSDDGPDNESDGLCDAADPDDDNDGIDDAIDGPGQSFTFSNVFNDDTTFGTIVSRGDLAVRIRDEAGPAGVRIKASGSGAAATVSVCGLANLSLNAGNETVVTCGSATVQVVSGPVTMSIGNFLRGSLPTGTKAAVSKTGSATTVCNTGSSGDITFTGIVITPGYCLTDSDTDGFFDPTEGYIGTSTTLACGVGAWPPDFDDSGEVDIFDVGPLKNAFGTKTGDPLYSVRVDLNGDTFINIADLGILKRFFGQLC